RRFISGRTLRFPSEGGERRLLPIVAPLVIIAGALIVLVVAGIEVLSAVRAYLAGSGELWTKDIMVHALLAVAVSLIIAAVLMGQRALQRIAAAEAAVRESEARLRLVANNVPALISYVDREQRYRFSNRTYDDWFGIAHVQMQGRSLAEVFGEEAYKRMKPNIERVLAGEQVEFEFTTNEGGRRRTLQVSCVPHAGEAVAHARRHGKNLAFLFIDLDNFKQVNDRLGHEVGDGLLKMIASRLRAAVRGDDFVARIGGDEFCVLLQDLADPREAAAVAQKLVHELKRSYRIGEHDLSSGGSIGIACVPLDGEDVPTLLRLADLAMYRAKEQGRSGYQFFSAALSEDAAAAEALSDELRAGMERGELFLVYQPRVDIATRQVIGAEALLRWRHPRYGVLAPESFLPHADDSGLLVPIGAWVLREACGQGRRWLEASIPSRWW